MRCTYRDERKRHVETGEESDFMGLPQEGRNERESVKSELDIEMEKDPRFRVITVRIRHLIENLIHSFLHKKQTVGLLYFLKCSIHHVLILSLSVIGWRNHEVVTDSWGGCNRQILLTVL